MAIQQEFEEVDEEVDEDFDEDFDEVEEGEVEEVEEEVRQIIEIIERLRHEENPFFFTISDEIEVEISSTENNTLMTRNFFQGKPVLNHPELSSESHLFNNSYDVALEIMSMYHYFG